MKRDVERENDCVSCPHRCQAALRLDSVVKGNEHLSYLDRGQAAEQLHGSRYSNTLALTLINVKLQCGLIVANWETKGHGSAQDVSLVLIAMEMSRWSALLWADPLHKEQRNFCCP